MAGGAAAATVGPWLVIVLAACGLAEVSARTRPRFRFRPPGPGSSGPGSSGPGSPGPGSPGPEVPGPGTPGPGRSGLGAVLLPLAAAVPAAGGLLAVAWEGLKVGALSYGGGFVIIPLMQHDAVHTYHWMTAGQFLSAVALGQVTPGPVVQTVAVVGYAAAGVGGGLLAALVAFTPSFLFVLGGGRYFDRLRASAAVQAFLTGAGPAAIGAIAGAALPLALALDAPVAARRARARRGLAARRTARRGQRDRGCRGARHAGLRGRRPRGVSQHPGQRAAGAPFGGVSLTTARAAWLPLRCAGEPLMLGLCQETTR